jgi:cytidine deaminase
VLHEFAPSLTIHIADAQGRSTTTTLDVLLPRSFGPSDLRGDQFEEAS